MWSLANQSIVSLLQSLGQLLGQQLTSAPPRGQSGRERAWVFQVCFAKSHFSGDPVHFTDDSQDFCCCHCFPKIPGAWAPAHNIPPWKPWRVFLSSWCPHLCPHPLPFPHLLLLCYLLSREVEAGVIDLTQPEIMKGDWEIQGAA